MNAAVCSGTSVAYIFTRLNGGAVQKKVSVSLVYLQFFTIFVYIVYLKVKVKVTFVQALKLWTGRTAHRGSKGIALPFHDHGTRRG